MKKGETLLGEIFLAADERTIDEHLGVDKQISAKHYLYMQGVKKGSRARPGVGKLIFLWWKDPAFARQ